MTARTSVVGAKEQNGDVEASNGALKRALSQALLVRGSRDFESRAAWQFFVDELMQKANRGRGRRVAEDIAAMRVLNVARLPEFVEVDFCVSESSTVRVKHCAYSVPSRLIGEWVRVRIFEDRIVVRYAGKTELDCDRLRGRNLKRIDYRHMIWSLVRKPGGFARYVYREEMCPSVVFRRAYDAIQTPHHGLKGDFEYLRILHLAARTIEADVETALGLLLTAGKALNADAVKLLARHAAAKAERNAMDRQRRASHPHTTRMGSEQPVRRSVGAPCRHLRDRSHGPRERHRNQAASAADEVAGEGVTMRTTPSLEAPARTYERDEANLRL